MRNIIFFLLILVTASNIFAQFGGRPNMGNIGGPIDRWNTNPTRRDIASAFPFNGDNVQHPNPIDWQDEVRRQRTEIEKEKQDTEKLREENRLSEEKRIAELEAERRRVADQKEKEKIEKELRDIQSQREEAEKERQREVTEGKSPKNYAVLIGVNKYTQISKKDNKEKGSRVAELDLEDLRYAVNDVTELAEVLVKGKFVTKENITILTDKSSADLLPTKENIVKCIAKTIARIESEDKNDEKSCVLVVFSGHGVAFPTQGGEYRSYVCPRGTDISMYETTKGDGKQKEQKWDIEGLISLADLFRGLEDETKVKKITILDACRNLTKTQESTTNSQGKPTPSQSSTSQRGGRVTRSNSNPQTKNNVQTANKFTAQLIVKEKDKSGKEIIKSASPVGLDNFKDSDIATYRMIFRLSSCEIGQMSHEDDGIKHGVFTNFLLKGIQGQADTDNNKQIDINELAKFVKEKTKQYAEQVLEVSQTPVSYSNEFDSCVISDF
ncbi:MAG: caspase family protein [Planctomycetaceae bacterium]|jgi:uncharacterized caspase-like protein|nr:caspase family protein [Planctomycetaceae bacterium]